MNRNDLFGAIEFIDDKIIENSEVRKIVKYQRRFTKRTLMLVAVLSLLTAFATAAFATNFFGLRDVLVNTNDPEVKSMMSLSGYTGSNEYVAAAEWNTFKESYDTDGSILEGLGNGEIPVEQKYEQCGAYTQEMADKIDEITKKYGLSLHSGFKEVPLEDWNTVIGDFVITDYDHKEFSDDAYSSILGGYMYDDGTFRYDGIFNATAGRLSVDYQFSRSVKGVFDPVFLNIGDIDDYQEQTLITDSGVEIAAAISEDKAVLITEFDSCFVTINVMGGTDRGITFDDLKDLANTFDFSAIENVKIKHAQDNKENSDNKPEADVNEIVDAESEWEQSYIEISREEGVFEKIPVDIVRVVNFDTTIAMDPEYFNHIVNDGIDLFLYEKWTGDAGVYYSVYADEEHTAQQLADILQQNYSSIYSGVMTENTQVGSYDAIAVYFRGSTIHPGYDMHYFIIPNGDSCVVIESQFSAEMYEGLYLIMNALFNTLKIG